MFFYPEDFKEKLEFHKIIDLLKLECLSEVSKTYFDELELSSDVDRIQQLLTETEEYKHAMEVGETLPIAFFESIKNDIPLLKKEGYVLEIEAIQRIHHLIKMGLGLLAYFEDGERQTNFPLLSAISLKINVDPSLVSDIDRVIDEEGNIRPNASAELLRISKLIRSKERELDRVFAQMITKYKNSGYLADTLESLRNGRRVLTVAAEHKRKINGIIHDESATGKTVYIEPQEVQLINNEVMNLFAERRKEVYKVLRDLCAQIRPFAEDLVEIEEVIIKLDTVRTKARLAILLNACQPKILDKPHFGFVEAYNPILKLKNDEEGKKTVPFTLKLLGQNRIIVISGPNAGGKSITMKSVGLLQLMLQSGILVPVDPDTEMGIFKRFFADIGDQQSIEDDLSTYSSRLKNMRHFIEEADEESLILIDEFGSGTDPKMGGAIAEAILRSLNFQKCYGVITTHYSNIKYFAFKTKGILNGSMEFDKASISPTYVLKVGSPGSSFAFEIAEKSGLDKKILKYAKVKTGKNEKAIDELLVDLQAERLELQNKMEKLLEKESKLERLTKTYEELHKELEFRRKKLKLERKEQKLSSVDQENRALQKVIKELKKEKDLEKAKAALEKRKKEKSETIKAVNNLKTEVFYADTFDVNDLKVGSFAKMRTGDSIGKIIEIRKGKAELEMGMMKVKVPLRDLIPTKAPIEQKRTRSINTKLAQTNSAFDQKLDVRGYTKNDALDFVEEFVDQALINNISDLKIIHGVGSGILKKAIHRKLREYKDIKRVYHPEEEFGGEGVTYISL
jgi:DNA mismatch repair protein MutS2